MPLQYSTTLRNARLDQIETTVGTSPILEIRSGAQPANCAAADAGTLLASMTLPSDWMAAASGGTKGLLGTWQDASANAGGTAAHWRIKDSGGSTCHLQGNITITGGGGDMTLDSLSITAAQQVTVTGFTLTGGNP
ncbi:MAG: hypothetical protein ABFD96_06030 [Armatimonadia bacterium]